MLRGVRPGPGKLVSAGVEFAVVRGAMNLESPAFGCGTHMSPRFTSTGSEVSPPLRWKGTPPFTKELVLIVEDADAPLPRPIVHAIVYGLAHNANALGEGALPGHRAHKKDKPEAGAFDGYAMGRNTFGGQTWLGPHPVAGHGPHRYYFQLFALDTHLSFKKPPKKKALVQAMRGHVLARGECVGIFKRD